MKKLFTMLAFSLITASVPALAQTSGGYKVKSQGGANLRQGPSTSSGVNTSIPQGAKVRVVEKRSDGWYKVEYNGKTGYVASDLVEQENNNKEDNNQANTQKISNNNSSEKKSSNASSNNASSNNRSSKNQSSKSGKKARAGSSGNADRNWGIGLRLGEPLGVTAKKYFAKSTALEISLGRSGRWGYRYNEDDFYRFDDYKDKDYYHYAGYKGGFATSLQVHYLWQKPINSAPGLEWYFGVGGQARFTPVTYYYYYNDGNWDKDWEKWHYVQDRRTDIDLGVDGILGIEYTFKEAPISIFGDVNLFLEVVDAPMFIYGQGGVGARYNF